MIDWNVCVVLPAPPSFNPSVRPTVRLTTSTPPHTPLNEPHHHHATTNAHTHSRQRVRRRGTWSTCATCPRSACIATRATPRACRPSSSSPSTATSSSGMRRAVRVFAFSFRRSVGRGCLGVKIHGPHPVPLIHTPTPTNTTSPTNTQRVPGREVQALGRVQRATGQAHLQRALRRRPLRQL